ncbi:uncharacterized protein LOC115214143 [Argonauta hians]
MEKLPHSTSIPMASSNVALDYGNHVIEALLKMSSDTDDDDEDQSFDQSNILMPQNENLLSPIGPASMPPVILHSQATNYKLYCSPITQTSLSNMMQSPTSQFISLKSEGILSPPLSSSSSSTYSWPKKSTKYSKEDFQKRQVCSNDEQRKPSELKSSTPRLEKRPTYANLSSIQGIEVNDEGNVDQLSTSSLSSLTDGYPAFTGDTSDCPYGQNYNKPRGLTKFEYHSYYIKQCRIEKTARTKKVWEKSPKRQQVISRKRKLLKKCQLENSSKYNTPTSAYHERKKKLTHNSCSSTKNCRKRKIVNSNLKSQNSSNSTHFQSRSTATADLLNETIGRLGQSDLILVDSGKESKIKPQGLDSCQTSVLSDTSYPSSSQTWSTPESMNTENISATSSYGLFKSRIHPSQFTSSPLPNISDSSSGPCQDTHQPNSSLNLSSVEEQVSASDSLDMSLEEGNKAFVEIDVSSNKTSQLQPGYNQSGDSKCAVTLSDSSVSLSVSLGERPDCLGQSCSSDSEPEADKENVETSDKSKSNDSNSFKHASDILSSTRNSQKDLSPESKGPVIISPLSLDMGTPDSPSFISFDENAQHEKSPLTNCKIIQSDHLTKHSKSDTDKKKNLLKITTQPFSISSPESPGPVLKSSSSTSSANQHLATTEKIIAAFKHQNQYPVLAKSKKMPFSTYPSSQQCHDKAHGNYNIPIDSFHDTSSVYFSPGKSSRHHRGLSPFSPISNIPKDNQIKPEGAKPKIHRHVMKKNHDKRTGSNSRKHRGMIENRRSRSHNKENTDLSDFERKDSKRFFDQDFITSGGNSSSRHTTPAYVSKDSGLGACRKSSQYQSPSQIVSLSNCPALAAAIAGTSATDPDPTPPDLADSDEIIRNTRQPIVDGFRLRNKKAVMKKFWNFQKKFIRKTSQNKEDTEFKTLAHF